MSTLEGRRPSPSASSSSCVTVWSRLRCAAMSMVKYVCLSSRKAGTSTLPTRPPARAACAGRTTGSGSAVVSNSGEKGTKAAGPGYLALDSTCVALRDPTIFCTLARATLTRLLTLTSASRLAATFE